MKCPKCGREFRFVPEGGCGECRYTAKVQRIAPILFEAGAFRNAPGWFDEEWFIEKAEEAFIAAGQPISFKFEKGHWSLRRVELSDGRDGGWIHGNSAEPQKGRW